jgi:glutathione S-transferase
MSESNLPPVNSDTMTAAESSSGPLAVAKACIGVWSTVRQCDPPASSTKTDHVRLITIVSSHFCEKVRWVMDLVERDESNPYYYTEDAHPPGLHAYEPLKASNNVASITPMVVFQDKDAEGDGGKATVMWESTAIMKKFMPSLYPVEVASEIEATEADFARRLGSPLRCVAYHHLLKKEHYATVQKLSADPEKVAQIESTFFEKFLPRGLASGMRKSLKINDEFAEASTKELRAVFADVSSKLEASGGPYLMDQKGKKSYGFTAADLTFAALAYPFLRPPEMKHWLLAEEDVPVEIDSLSQELAATRAGAHVLKIYREHRPVDKESGVAVMKYADRNRTFFQWLFGY